MSDARDDSNKQDMQDRENLLRQDGFMLGVAICGLINGMHFSPWFDIFAGPVAAIMAGFFLSSPLLLFYFASLTVSVASVIIAGIPAAIFERVTGRKKSDGASMLIWFACAFALALPCFGRMLNLL